MTVDETAVRAWDPDDPETFDWWEDYALRDTRPVSPYLFERGDPVPGDRTVDTAHYTSQAFCDLETERLWPRTWQMACRANDIPQVGDYVEYQIAGRSIVLVRDAPDSVKAFHNACRHRGRALVSGCGHAEQFSCPFHGWGYRLDGSNQTITARWDFKTLDPATCGLLPCRTEVFDGWVFVNQDLDAVPLADYLGETIARHLLVYPSERMWKSWHYGVVVPSNWKVMAEAFFETYHIARTHPSLLAAAGDIQAQYDTFGLHARLCTLFLVPCVIGGGNYTEKEIFVAALGLAAARFGVSEGDTPAYDLPDLPDGMTARQLVADLLRGQWAAQGLDFSAVSDAEMIDGILYLLFPNFMTFRGPGGHVAYRFRPAGTDPDTCIFEAMNLVPLAPGAELPPDVPLHVIAPGETLEDYAKDLASLGYLLDQDVSNAEGIQRGLRSLNKIHCADKQEQNIVAFHRNLVDWLSREG